MTHRLATFAMAIILSGCLSAQGADTQAEASEKPDYLQEDEWPRTCADAVSWLVEHLDEESKTLVRETPRSDLSRFHFGWGMGIRNNFGLWRGNRDLMTSCLAIRPGTEDHPDGVSMVIIEETWARLRGE